MVIFEKKMAYVFFIQIYLCINYVLSASTDIDIISFIDYLRNEPMEFSRFYIYLPFFKYPKKTN